MTLLDSHRSSSPRLTRSLGASAIITLILAMLITGCIDLRSTDDENSSDDEATPIPSMTHEDDAIPSSLASAVVPVRAAGSPDELLGSAVIITEDGFLLTNIDVVRGAIEVELPDGSHHQPALVTSDPETGLAMLKVPATGLPAASMSSERPGEGAEVFATGHDGSPGGQARIAGTLTGLEEPPADADLHIRGASLYKTDIHVLGGFIGGALSDGNGGLCGIIMPGESGDSEPRFHAVSHWYIIAWLEHRETRISLLQEESESWESTTLPGNWSIRQPDGWNVSLQSDSDLAYRAELTPADPDVSLQLAISVEGNEYGTDAGAFVDQVFGERSSARVWSIDQHQDRPFVRATMSQEGALVDVAYLLDEDFLIAVSLTSGYRPESDHQQVDEARALFEVVVESIRREA